MYKIMIVEDDAVIAAEIRDYLCRWDMQGHIAHRLDDIVGEYIRIKPQLIIMDIALPFYNGFYWCQQLIWGDGRPFPFCFINGESSPTLTPLSAHLRPYRP